MRTETVCSLFALVWLVFAAWAAFDGRGVEVVLCLLILSAINLATSSILRRLPAR